jgi:hypothetical protein
MFLVIFCRLRYSRVGGDDEKFFVGDDLNSRSIGGAGQGGAHLRRLPIV